MIDLLNVVKTSHLNNILLFAFKGMCDLVAPLLVIFDDEALTHACFAKLMERMLR